MGSSKNPNAVKPTIKLDINKINRLTRTMRNKVFKIKNAKTQLVLLFAVLYYAANHLEWFNNPDNSMVSDIRMGIFGTYLFIAYIGTLVLPEPVISRPHPLFWRIVQGFTFSYLVVLCFLLFFVIFDNNLGEALPERSYADDCRVYTPDNSESKFYNIVNSIDEFVAAHFFGWTMKMWIFRNNVMAWTASILFEVYEWTMEVWLDNFAECWWDHFILDMFGCNLIGMLIGVYTINKFKMKKYHWFLEPNEKMEKMTSWQKFKYYFTSREEYIKKGKWHWLADTWTFNSVLWYFSINSLLELSYFFNKTNLEIPPPHWLMAVRIWTIALFCILATAEYYEYITKRKANAMGANAFLIHVIIILEAVLWLKHLDYNRIFKEKVKLHMQLVWLVIGAFVAAVHVYISSSNYVKRLRAKKANELNKVKAE